MKSNRLFCPFRCFAPFNSKFHATAVCQCTWQLCCRVCHAHWNDERDCGHLKVHQILHRTSWRNWQMTNICSLSFPRPLFSCHDNSKHSPARKWLHFISLKQFQFSLLHNWSQFPPLHFYKVFIPTGKSNLLFIIHFPVPQEAVSLPLGQTNNHLSIGIGFTQCASLYSKVLQHLPDSQRCRLAPPAQIPPAEDEFMHLSEHFSVAA